jgi:hypothetical protein
LDAEKNDEYVTHYRLERRLESVEDKINDVDRRQEDNFKALDKTLTVLSSTFNNLDTNVEEMVKNQKQTNDILIKHDMRITATESATSNLTKHKKEYISDVFKLIGVVLAALFGLIGTIITVAFNFI